MKYEQSTVRRVASFVSTRRKEIYELKLDFSFNFAPGKKLLMIGNVIRRENGHLIAVPKNTLQDISMW